MRWNFWKKRKPTDLEGKIIYGIILLQDYKKYNVEKFISILTSTYNHSIANMAMNDHMEVFEVNGKIITIGYKPKPIANESIAEAIKYAYYWPDASEIIKEHKNHLIVVIKGASMIYDFILLTQSIYSLLKSSNAIAVYMESQCLIIPAKDYLTEASQISFHNLPINLWIYFGFIKSKHGNCGYTVGLKEFGKKELEIIHSKNNFKDIHITLRSISNHILERKIDFKSGDFCRLSAEEKVLITETQGEIHDGVVYKLHY